MDWSYSNLEKLFEVGRAAGEDFLRQHKGKMLDYKDVFGSDLPKCD